MLIVQPSSWAPASPSADLIWAQSRDGQTLTAQGCDPVALLPHDTDTVLVLPMLATSWHRVTLPKIASSRLRQALDGLLEDRLLSDPTHLHLAVQPAAQATQPTWVCACDKALLTTWLDMLHAANRLPGRIVPDQAPQTETVWTAIHTAGQDWWVHAGPNGVWPTPLGAHAHTGPAAHTLSDSRSAASTRTEPACAGAAEAAMGHAVQLETAAQRLLRSVQSDWNLAQFDIKRSAHTRRGQQLMHAVRQWTFAPAWRATRWGLIALVLSSLMGLSVRAWEEQQALSAKRQHIQQLLSQTFPHISLVIDAPLQMQREVDRLQRAGGSAGGADLDVFLSDFSASSIEGVEFNAIEFNPTDIRITLHSASESKLPQLQAALQSKGWHTRFASPTLTVTRTAPVPSAKPART